MTVCPIWPDKKGVDLAVWNAAPRHEKKDATGAAPAASREYGREDDERAVAVGGAERPASVAAGTS